MKTLDDANSFRNKYPNATKAIVIAIGLLCLLLAILFIIKWAGIHSYNSKQQKANANLANAMLQLGNLETQAEQTNTDIAVQKEKIAQAQREANEANKEAAERQRLEDLQNANLQNSLQNLNAVRQGNYNNSTLDEANKARCAAYPTSVECR